MGANTSVDGKVVDEERVEVLKVVESVTIGIGWMLPDVSKCLVMIEYHLRFAGGVFLGW